MANKNKNSDSQYKGVCYLNKVYISLIRVSLFKYVGLILNKKRG